MAWEHTAALVARSAQASGLRVPTVGLFPVQRAFVADPSPRKIALCSRRAGKSHAVAAWLLDGAADAPGEMSLYVALSRNSARMILWRALEQIDRAQRIGLRLGEVDGQLIVRCPNGHRLWLAGCKDRSEVSKFRGPPYRRAVIDEAQAFGGYLSELLDDAIDPTLLDLRGEVAMVGTPGPIPAGYFYRASTGDGGAAWPTHRWTVRDNPHLPHVDAWLAERRARNGWTEQHPTYRREWLGEWVRDEGALVYPYDDARNGWSGALPEGAWRYGIGVDLGASEHEQGTAFVAAAHRDGHPEVYIVEAQTWSGLIPSRTAAYLETWIARYTVNGVVPRVVVDEGGLGKGYAEEWRQTYQLPVERAEKSRKRAYIELVAGDMRAGLLRIDARRARPLVDELQVMTWDDDHAAPDERFADHAADAMLYIVRALRPDYRPEIEPPRPGSPAAVNAEAAEIRAETMRRLRSGQRKRWWES